MEDFAPLVTFEDYINLLPTLKESGIKTIELLPVFEHCTSEKIGWRWAVRNYSRLDPHRGNETDLNNFLNEAHNLGIKVVVMISVEDSTTPEPTCELIGTGIPFGYDEDGMGGHLYQYQEDHPEKNILLKNSSNEYACHPMGWGYAVDCDSEDTISLWSDIYEDVMSRGFDGVRLDSPAINYCNYNEKIYVGCNEYPCPDPVEEKHSNLPLYRTLRELKKPEQVFISKNPSTLGLKYKWSCEFPYYHPYTDLDEIAEVSEDYGFTTLLQKHIATTTPDIDSEGLVNWINTQYNEHILYNRERFRFYRNWNYYFPEYLKFVSNDPKYYPTVTLVSTIPGIPKVTYYELIGILDWEKIHYPPVNNLPEQRRAHWKKVLNIRNNSNALKYGTIENVWKSGDNVYAYLRNYKRALPGVFNEALNCLFPRALAGNFTPRITNKAFLYRLKCLLSFCKEVIILNEEFDDLRAEDITWCDAECAASFEWEDYRWYYETEFSKVEIVNENGDNRVAKFIPAYEQSEAMNQRSIITYPIKGDELFWKRDFIRYRFKFPESYTEFVDAFWIDIDQVEGPIHRIANVGFNANGWVIAMSGTRHNYHDVPPPIVVAQNDYKLEANKWYTAEMIVDYSKHKYEKFIITGDGFKREYDLSEIDMRTHPMPGWDKPFFMYYAGIRSDHDTHAFIDSIVAGYYDDKKTKCGTFNCLFPRALAGNFTPRITDKVFLYRLKCLLSLFKGNTYAYLREYEEEKVIVVINFKNLEAISVLDLSFLDEGTILYDILNEEEFIVDNPENFEISTPAYGSRILEEKKT